MALEPVTLIVCVGPRCDAEGRGNALFAGMEEALKNTFPEAMAEGRLRISTRDCLRLCTSDPVVRLEPSGDASSNPDLQDLLDSIRLALRAQK